MIGLRELRTEDASGMLDWLNDEEVNQYFSFSSKEHDIDYAINYINKVKLDEKSKHFAIVDDQDEYMGTISLKNIDLDNKHAEYAIAIRKKFQGTGIGTRASQLIIEYAKSKLNLHKIYLTVLTSNKAAIYLYIKLGFKLSGIFKEHISKNGVYFDLEYYEIILDEEINETSSN